jgi:hypothetical protein
VKTVFRNGEVGYGSAMAVVLTVIVLGVGLAYSRVARRRPRPAAETDEDAADAADAQPAVPAILQPDGVGAGERLG